MATIRPNDELTIKKFCIDKNCKEIALTHIQPERHIIRPKLMLESKIFSDWKSIDLELVPILNYLHSLCFPI